MPDGEQRPQEEFREVAVGPAEGPGEAPQRGHVRVQGEGEIQ